MREDYEHQRMEIAPFGWVDTLRRPGAPSLFFRDADGEWWDAPVFLPVAAFSASHMADELNDALASVALTLAPEEGDDDR